MAVSASFNGVLADIPIEPAVIADVPVVETAVEVNPIVEPVASNDYEVIPASIPEVPFYSQIRNISSPKWQKLSCGIADLAMIINFYKPGAVVPDVLLMEGLAAGAFIDGVGWKHQGLADLAASYGLKGKIYGFSHLNKTEAFAALLEFLKDGPVIASVHYTFDPNSTIPHLVVINGVEGDFIYYNDPATRGGNQKISIAGFLRGWKERIIVIRPESLARN